MKRSRVLLAAAAVLVALVVVVAVWRPWVSRPAPPVRVGVLLPLTGEAAAYGEKGRKAVELAVDQVNAEGGINGRRVEVVFEDSAADPKTGATAMQKLVHSDGCVAVVGDVVSAVTLVAAPIAERNQVVLLSPTSSAPAITNAGEYVYRIWPSDLAEGRAVAELAARRGYKRVAVLHMNNEYGVAISNIFRETFERAGGAVVSAQGYAPDATDFRTALATAKAAKPDAVYVAGYFADSATVVRQAREIGLSVQFLGTTAVEDPKFLELAGEAAEGFIYPLATGFDASSEEPTAKAFVTAYRQRFGSDPAWVEAHCYDAFMLLCRAMKGVSGDLTGASLKKAIDSLGEYPGVTGVIKFDENGDVAKPIRFKQVRGRKFQSLPN